MQHCARFGKVAWGIAATGVLLLSYGQASTQAQTTLSVTNFGARGDAVLVSANTVSNSATVVCPSNSLTSEDIGKVIMLFGAGPPGAGYTGNTRPTNHQDFLAFITAVDGGTNITLDRVCGVTSNGVVGLYGTQNAPAFQACVNVAGTNAVVNIPNGRYLLIPPEMLDMNFVTSNSYYVPIAVTIQKGGIHVIGESRDETVLTGNGAWVLKPALMRGTMFACRGPVTNDAPLIFENLTMDGGLPQGIQAYRGWPACSSDGDGWDVTHGAVIDIGRPPFHQHKAFINCNITHWRGEMFKSVVGQTGVDGFIGMTNWVFADGNASAMNFSFTHVITGCTFSNLDMAMEFYEGYMFNPCFFENSFVQARGGLVIVGALTNRAEPSYTIRNNTINSSSYALLLSPARNVHFTGNSVTAPVGIQLGGPGAQGSDTIGDITVTNNTFAKVESALVIAGTVDGVLVTSNTAPALANSFVRAYGGRATNFVITFNRGNPGITLNLGNLTSGQWIYDDPLNEFGFARQDDFVGRTNAISYASGMRHLIWVSKTSSVWYLDDTEPAKIPPGAAIVLKMENPAETKPNPLYLSASLSGVPVTITNGTLFTFQWTNGAWKTLSPTAELLPPSELHVLPEN